MHQTYLKGWSSKPVFIKTISCVGRCMEFSPERYAGRIVQPGPCLVQRSIDHLLHCHMAHMDAAPGESGPGRTHQPQRGSPCIGKRQSLTGGFGNQLRRRSGGVRHRLLGNGVPNHLSRRGRNSKLVGLDTVLRETD